MSYRKPDRLARHIQEDDEGLTVFVMQVPDGEPKSLTGVAALIWVAAVEGEDVVATIAEATRQPRETIESDVLSYLAGLVNSGLLEEEQS